MAEDLGRIWNLIIHERIYSDRRRCPPLPIRPRNICSEYIPRRQQWTATA